VQPNTFSSIVGLSTLQVARGLAILGTVLAINLVGDRLRDALDPRLT
jgi:ABC-type dipeptide/oligopeptide/nickel transport system permease subunit